MGLAKLKASTANIIPAAFRFKQNEIILPECKQVNTVNGRYYVSPKGTPMPSITTILSNRDHATLDAWRERVGKEQADTKSEMARYRGENLHFAIECYLKNKEVDLSNPLTREMFKQVKKLLANENLLEVHGVEKRLYSETLGIAGTCDFIGLFGHSYSMGASPRIVDWKSSSYDKSEEYIENYFLQLTAYSLMYEEMTGTRISDGQVIIACENEANAQSFLINRDKYILKLLQAIKQYKESNDAKKLFTTT